MQFIKKMESFTGIVMNIPDIELKPESAQSFFMGWNRQANRV
jgi:hypothetical protein